MERVFAFEGYKYDATKILPEEYDNLLGDVEREGFEHLTKLLKEENPTLDDVSYDKAKRWYDTFLPFKPKCYLDIYQLRKYQQIYEASKKLYYNIIDYMSDKEANLLYVDSGNAYIRIYELSKHLEFLVYLLTMHDEENDSMKDMIPEKYLKMLAFLAHMPENGTDTRFLPTVLHLLIKDILNEQELRLGVNGVHMTELRGLFMAGVVNSSALSLINILRDNLEEIEMTDEVYAGIKWAAMELYEDYGHISAIDMKYFNNSGDVSLETFKQPWIRGVARQALGALIRKDPREVFSVLKGKLKVLTHLISAHGEYGEVSTSYRKAYNKLIVECFVTAAVMDTRNLQIHCREATTSF